MSKLINKTILLVALIASVGAAYGRSFAPVPQRHLDLVIVLDVSGSMSGLIDSARQRLWDIVNDLGQARPHPVLRVAIISFGNPSYGEQTGYVRIDQPLTNDLDAVNQTLFSFTTNGGDEYVARAIDTAVAQLNWSTQPGALKMLFVAGNESALQDPVISVEQATRHALDQDIVVNTLYCGGATDSDAVSWRTVAGLNQGVFASIDQNAAAIANVATPMDQPLAELNAQLNATFVPFGTQGEAKRKNQLEQDANVAQLSAPAAASRTVTKAGKMYDARQWDLVDAIDSGTALEEVPESELPAPMRAMGNAERKDYVATQAARRSRVKQEIAQLNEQRKQYMGAQKALRGDADEGLDEAIRTGLRAVAEKKGFVFDDKSEVP